MCASMSLNTNCDISKWCYLLKMGIMGRFLNSEIKYWCLYFKQISYNTEFPISTRWTKVEDVIFSITIISYNSTLFKVVSSRKRSDGRILFLNSLDTNDLELACDWDDTYNYIRHLFIQIKFCHCIFSMLCKGNSWEMELLLQLLNSRSGFNLNWPWDQRGQELSSQPSLVNFIAFQGESCWFLHVCNTAEWNVFPECVLYMGMHR